jgi:DNA polymerase-3 subunit delta'
MNWELLGHEWAVELLTRHITTNNHRHAYLFTGPPGIGRRSLALRFAQALNCIQTPQPGHPCLACQNCLQIGRMQHPDLSLVQAEYAGAVLKVDQIRQMQRNLSLTPYQARYRVAILLRFEEAQDGASNALLKTLEEPPGKVILLLTAQSADNLLPTIVSRCEAINLKPMRYDLLAQGLMAKFQISQDEALFLAHVTNGRPGLAIHYHQQADSLENRKRWLDDLLHLLSANRVERLLYAKSFPKEKEIYYIALAHWSSFWHDVLRAGAGSSSPLTNLDLKDEISQLAQQLDLVSTRRLLSTTMRTRGLLDHNINQRLALEVLLLDLPQI